MRKFENKSIKTNFFSKKAFFLRGFILCLYLILVYINYNLILIMYKLEINSYLLDLIQIKLD